MLLTHAKKKQKGKKRERKKNPRTIAKVFSPSKLCPWSPSPALFMVLKKHSNFIYLYIYFFASCNIFLVLFFNRIMNFMGLSTGLTAYEELPRNTLGEGFSAAFPTSQNEAKTTIGQ